MLPRIFGFPWEREEISKASAASPTPPSTPEPTDGELVLVMRPKGRNPTWLVPYQERLRQANRIAVERTRHLKGAQRVRAMNDIVGSIIREG